MALSDSWLKANTGKPRPAVEVKSDRDGLSVRVSPLGKIVYQLRYRYAGKAKRVDLGTYPLMPLKAARTLSLELRALLEQGHDPQQVLRNRQQSLTDAPTLKSVFTAWYGQYCEGAKKGSADIKRTFEIHVFPDYGDCLAGELTMVTWLGLLEKLKKHSQAIANRVLTNGKQMYGWAIKRYSGIQINPLSNIHAGQDLQIKQRARTRCLTNEELDQLLQVMLLSRMAPKNRIFLILCLIYGCRNGELKATHKAHLDYAAGVWLIPAENHKIGHLTHKPLMRPIIPITKVLFERAAELSAQGPYLFNADRTDRGMGKTTHVRLPVMVRKWLAQHGGISMEWWATHDLRRTARTNFSTLTEPHVAEIMLGHKLPGQWQTYDQHQYLVEQATAYQKWWDRLQELSDYAALFNSVAFSQSNTDSIAQRLALPMDDLPGLGNGLFSRSIQR